MNGERELQRSYCNVPALVGGMSINVRRDIGHFVVDSELISKQAGKHSIWEGKELIKEVRGCPVPLLPFLPQPLSPSIDCWGDTHLIPTDDLCRGKGQPPQLPATLPWGEWLPGWELTLSSGFFLQPRVTPFGSKLQLISSLCWFWRQGVRLKLVPRLPGASFPFV